MHCLPIDGSSSRSSSSYAAGSTLLQPISTFTSTHIHRKFPFHSPSLESTLCLFSSLIALPRRVRRAVEICNWIGSCLLMGGFDFLNCGSILIGLAVSIFVIRLAYVLYWTGRPLRTVQQRVSTLIILGSGGHTAEMLSIVNVLQKDRFLPRFYVAAATDCMSLEKARVLEESLIQKGEIGHENIEEVAYFEQIYRSREVGQSYLTSICTTLVATVHALWVVLKFRPEVILCNGPGTCIPLCLIAFIFKVAGVRWSSIFYIESIARVRRLSLSGFLLYKSHVADQFYVQWPQLQSKYPRAQPIETLHVKRGSKMRTASNQEFESFQTQVEIGKKEIEGAAVPLMTRT